MQPLHVARTRDPLVRLERRREARAHAGRVEEIQVALLEQLHVGHCHNVRQRRSTSMAAYCGNAAFAAKVRIASSARSGSLCFIFAISSSALCEESFAASKARM